MAWHWATPFFQWCDLIICRLMCIIKIHYAHQSTNEIIHSDRLVADVERFKHITDNRIFFVLDRQCILSTWTNYRTSIFILRMRDPKSSSLYLNVAWCKAFKKISFVNLHRCFFIKRMVFDVTRRTVNFMIWIYGSIIER